MEHSTLLYETRKQQLMYFESCKGSFSLSCFSIQVKLRLQKLHFSNFCRYDHLTFIFCVSGWGWMAVIHLCGRYDTTTGATPLSPSGGSNVAWASNNCGLPDSAKDVGTCNLFPPPWGSTSYTSDSGSESVHVSLEILCIWQILNIKLSITDISNP